MSIHAPQCEFPVDNLEGRCKSAAMWIVALGPNRVCDLHHERMQEEDPWLGFTPLENREILAGARLRNLP